MYKSIFSYRITYSMPNLFCFYYSGIPLDNFILQWLYSLATWNEKDVCWTLHCYITDWWYFVIDSTLFPVGIERLKKLSRIKNWETEYVIQWKKIEKNSMDDVEIIIAWYSGRFKINEQGEIDLIYQCVDITNKSCCHEIM